MNASTLKVKQSKRRQVKKACQHCHNAHTACDEQRPCKRCLQYGLEESCVDIERKTRKKVKSESNEPSPTKQQEQSDLTYTPPLTLVKQDAVEEVDLLKNKDIPIQQDTSSHYFSSIFDFISDNNTTSTLSEEPWEKLDFGLITTKESSVELPTNSCVAIWSLDGTLKSASPLFITTFKIPQQFIAFSTIGPHFTSLIPCLHFEKNFQIFGSIFKGDLNQYNGELVLKEFNSELSHSTTVKEVPCFVSLNSVMGQNNTPLYIYSHVSLPQ